jgi:uncharacterized protein
MPFSLHAAFVPTAVQIASSVRALVDKAEAFATEKGISAEVLLNTRLIADMLPLAVQFRFVVQHSGGAIAAIRAGSFTPDLSPVDPTFDHHRAALDEAIATLEATTVEELEGYVGRDMRFAFRERRLAFTADNYLLSFAQPNYMFHATTAYNILRSQGVALGKRDFSGAVRIKG